MSDAGPRWLTRQGSEHVWDDREGHGYEAMEVYSPDSPLGRALLGARENDTRNYFLPDGGSMSVTLVTAKPFRE